ncbi:MAG TPA: hypothetical protein VF855_14160, partial [Acidimicrobiales bacterium]
EQMKPILKAKGFDVDAAIVALLPALAPDDVTTIMGAANTPVVLQYVDSFDGSTFVDLVTGSPVNVSAVSETLGAVPEPESVQPLIDTLKKYPNVPEAVTAVQALEAVSGEPVPIYTTDYHQTAASVTEAVADAKESGRMIRLAETWIPNGMAAFGGLLALVGLLLILIPKRKAHVPMSALTPAPVEVVPEAAPFETVTTSTAVDRETVLH